MFWGVILQPDSRYSQVVEHSFHLSMASLDIRKAGDEVVEVMLLYGGKNYLLCTLQKKSVWQVPLDLNIGEGYHIAFTCSGPGHVHLTGYLIQDENSVKNCEDSEDCKIERHQKEMKKLNDKYLKREAAASPENATKAKRLKSDTTESLRIDDDDVEMDEDSEDDTEESEDENDLMQEEQEEDDSDEDKEEEQEQETSTKSQLQPQQNRKKEKGQGQQQNKLKKEHDKQKSVNEKATTQERQSKQKKNKTEQKLSNNLNVQNEVKKKVIEGGVQVEDMKLGNGISAKAGRYVSVHYVGRLKNGKKFDETTGGNCLKFQLGKKEVIKGWEVGLLGMKPGGKRRITIPPNMGYGAKGSPPLIPGNSTLIFDINLKDVY